MNQKRFEVESYQVFSKSKLWQLNRDFYQQSGIEAWSKGIVPYQVTSNAQVGKTYATLIFGLLKDQAAKGAVKETVYIIELGAGHGGLAFHILKYLEKLTSLFDLDLPPYCYVLSDIVEDNLSFFKNHPQLQRFYKSGNLDYAYYDAIGGDKINLRVADLTIDKAGLKQPLIALANYFFDSIPNDLFYIKDEEISMCSIALHTSSPMASMESYQILKDLKLSYKKDVLKKPYYDSQLLNTILKEYQLKLKDSHLFFPERSIQCIANLRALSTKGLMLLSMDKGVHDMAKLDGKAEPEIITHGSFSLWVNYHALGSYCEHLGGKALFPAYSTFHIQVACLMFVEDVDHYKNTSASYQLQVNDFGPDDFISIKKLSYANISLMSLMDLMALLRLSAYDATFFIKILPRIKELIKRLSMVDRERVVQSLDIVWSNYFSINEKQDLALSIAGILYDLGFYARAVVYFEYSLEQFGVVADTLYNKIQCYYQMREDVLFVESLAEAKLLFPEATLFDQLDLLDLNAQ